jgi:glycosyltransferase involved in cell wall biosynthesis
VRIAHVIHAFPPFSRAGSENYVEALAREQLLRHEVVVFHRVSDPERPEYEIREDRSEGIPVVRVNRTFRDLQSFRDTYRSDAVAAGFGAFLDRFRPDAVHFHHTTCLSTTCVHEAKRRGIPVVYTLHDFWLLCPRGQLVRRDLSLCERHTDADCVRCMAWQLRVRGGHARVRELLERSSRLARLRLPRELYRRFASRPFAREDLALAEIRERTAHVLETCALVDRFVAPSRFLGERYVEFGVPERRIAVSDYGFDLARWRHAEPGLREPTDPLRVAYLGTWIPSKGVHVLVEAFRGLDPARAVLDVHGYAVPYEGFDDYEGHLRRLAAGAPHVRLCGRYAPDDVPGLLARADVLVVPSIWYENSPLTIHEAFLAGVPVVTSDRGGMQELVQHEKNGLTFSLGGVASLRSALERLAGEAGLLERLRRGIPRVKEIGENAREIEALYHGVARGVDGRAGTGPRAAREV